jgi:hypothetical protein
MKVFTKRNALVGALVTWVARKRIERKLNKLAGHTPRRRRFLVGAGIVTSAALAAGALFARRSSPGDAQVA